MKLVKRRQVDDAARPVAPRIFLALPHLVRASERDLAPGQGADLGHVAAIELAFHVARLGSSSTLPAPVAWSVVV